MWACIAVWMLLDLAMIKFGSELPTWLAFDGMDALHRDFWVVVFVCWMWLAYREPSPISSRHREGE
jgi:hypothetical protein